MAFASQYLSKLKGFVPRIEDIPSNRLKFIVVVPVFCEPDLTDALESLWACSRVHGDIEIILVVNSADDSPDEVIQVNKDTISDASAWIKDHDDARIRFHIIDCNGLPARDAGVGPARKIGMDEAVYRFDLINNPEGYILSYDADCLCDDNYFTAIEESVNNRSVKGFDIYFEHPVTGEEFSQSVYDGIVDYELHLRYVNQFLRYCGFPFAHHTVGSCFGVRADIYAAQGGMNKRKAGEDFYFLHKIIPLGNFPDIITTRVIPSPRESFRVPFGTGVAIKKYLNDNREMMTYNPQSFIALRHFFANVARFFKAGDQHIKEVIDACPDVLKTFLAAINTGHSIAEINGNCSSPDSFMKRFFRWFDAFRIVKFLNYAGRDQYPDVPVSLAVKYFLKEKGWEGIGMHTDSRELLRIMRKIERS